MTTWTRWLAIPLLALGLSGCAGEADIAGIERQISTSIKDQTELRVDVKCPDSVDWETGSDFRCIAKGEGEQVIVTVYMENDDGDITWQMG